jgi:hypothetical protein
MKYNFSGKGIFVFCDAASANSLCAILASLIKDGKIAGKDFLAFTNENGVIPNDFASLVQRQQETIQEVLEQFKPSYVFTGATTLNDYEHRWRKEAIWKKIKTYSFIDHWNFYSERFIHGGETVLPDEIWLINDLAYSDAVNAGLPAKKLRISGNPYYETVRNYRPLISRKDFLTKYRIDAGKKIILFVSDNIKDVFNNNDGSACPLGFDEFSILQEVFICLRDLYENGALLDDFQFVIKLHPRCSTGKYDKLIYDPAYSFINPLVIEQEEPLMVNYYADIVLGMFSNMVLEAMLMNKEVIRIQIGQIGHDMFKFSELTAPLILSRKDLVTALSNSLGLRQLN